MTFLKLKLQYFISKKKYPLSDSVEKCNVPKGRHLLFYSTIHFDNFHKNVLNHLKYLNSLKIKKNFDILTSEFSRNLAKG